jgi:hypothetical protein
VPGLWSLTQDDGERIIALGFDQGEEVLADALDLLRGERADVVHVEPPG